MEEGRRVLGANQRIDAGRERFGDGLFGDGIWIWCGEDTGNVAGVCT